MLPMATKDIIKAGRERLGMTHQAFGDAVGVSRGAVQQWERGTTAPKRGHQPKVAALLGVSVATLMEQPGESVEMVAVNLAHMRAQPQPIEMENNPEYPAVRRVSVKAQAGIAGFAIEDVQDTAPIVFRADWYKGKGYRPERMMALRVAGESMLPGLGPDDLVVVNTESAAPKDGCAFLVAYYGEVVVKRLIFDEGMWWLCSDNPDQRRYPRKRCDDGTQIIGEVVYKQSERV
jgi:phage repressor protein C with HTH and peptisase S24 domain